MKATTCHPRANDQGHAVRIHSPSTPSPASAWGNTAATVVVVPDGPVPAGLNGIPFAPWSPPDDADAWWEAEAARMAVAEPLFSCPPGLKAAAGVVVLEPDGRIWLAQPTNKFGGVAHVVPKGRHDSGALAAAAQREAWEELGLRVCLTGHLVDLRRSLTFNRFFVGHRIGGDPSRMGWESQGVVLCPINRLPELLNGLHDAPLVAAIQAHVHARFS